MKAQPIHCSGAERHYERVFVFKELANVTQQSSEVTRMGGAANCGPRDPRIVARDCDDPSTMEGSTMITTRFGNKLKMPSTIQIKHQLLLRWLADQSAKEATEANGKTPVPSERTA
jgi:hypothetical protein